MYIPTLPSVRPAPPLIARGGWKSYVDRSKLAGGNGTGPLLSAVQLGRQSVQASLDALRPEPDAIASALQKLAGVPESGRPIFLKVVYHGPRAMEELCQYDPNMVVGIMGGSSGTTYDAFKLIYEAQKYGARVALFGRKINNAEHQMAFIEMLRLITDGKISPEEAVRAYHGVLQGKGIKPHRILEDDLKLTDQAMSYAGGAKRGSSAVTGTSSSTEATGAPQGAWPKLADGSPDFARMTSGQRLVYDQARLGRRFG